MRNNKMFKGNTVLEAFFQSFYIIQDRLRPGLSKYINEKLCKYVVER